MLRHFHKLVRQIIFVSLVSALSSCWLFYQPTLDIQGHRGARGLFPENTLIGFRKTIEMGVTTLELDLGLTKGLVPVVSHDPYLNQNLCFFTKVFFFNFSWFWSNFPAICSLKKVIFWHAWGATPGAIGAPRGTIRAEFFFLLCFSNRRTAVRLCWIWDLLDLPNRFLWHFYIFPSGA